MATILSVQIGGQRFYLPGGTDMERLARDVVDAVQAGGRVIAVPTSSAEHVQAVVSPGLPIIFTSLEMEDAEEDPPGAAWAEYPDSI